MFGSFKNKQRLILREAWPPRGGEARLVACPLCAAQVRKPLCGRPSLSVRPAIWHLPARLGGTGISSCRMSSNHPRIDALVLSTSRHSLDGPRCDWLIRVHRRQFRRVLLAHGLDWNMGPWLASTSSPESQLKPLKLRAFQGCQMSGSRKFATSGQDCLAANRI